MTRSRVPEHVIQTAARPKKKKQQQEEPPKYTICLPYVAGLGEALRRVCRKHNIQTAFTTMDTLRRQLTRVKDTDPIIKKSGVVYRIPCSCGLVYIGETKRSLETCLKEHQAACRRREMEKSAIAEHTWTKKHSPDWDNISIIDQARNNTTLLVKEALHISLARQHTLLNRDQGTAISNCWRLLLRRASQQLRHDPTSQPRPPTWILLELSPMDSRSSH